MVKVFKDYTISITGNFGRERSIDEFKRWVPINGGRFASEVDETVNILISSKDHFLRNVDAVKAAQRNKQCKIVTLDWFEDCLTDKRRHAPSKYACAKIFRLSAAEKSARRAKERKALKGEGEFMLLVKMQIFGILTS